jgi:hypothetical protein
MSKSAFIPAQDHDFLVWFDHFIANLTAEYGVSEADLTALKAANSGFHDKTTHFSEAAALAKQATVDKKNGRDTAEALIRAEVRRIKARSDYTEGQGAHLGIEGPKDTYDLSASHPDLTGIDKTGGLVTLSFNKYKSDGINIYCQRENDVDWVLLARATVSPYQDNRALLQIGKPELRRYTAVFMLKDKEIGKYSDDIVINCAP